MLMPRKVKHRKQQRGHTAGHSKGGTHLSYGDYGIQALEPGWITARQIEAARIAMTRRIRRGGAGDYLRCSNTTGGVTRRATSRNTKLLRIFATCGRLDSSLR